MYDEITADLNITIEKHLIFWNAFLLTADVKSDANFWTQS